MQQRSSTKRAACCVCCNITSIDEVCDYPHQSLRAGMHRQLVTQHIINIISLPQPRISSPPAQRCSVDLTIGVVVVVVADVATNNIISRPRYATIHLVAIYIVVVVCGCVMCLVLVRDASNAHTPCILHFWHTARVA